MNATRADRMVLAAFHSTIFVMGLPGNVLIIMVFGLSREFRSRASSTCLIIMTIADLITCVCAVPYYTIGLLMERFDQDTPIYSNLCKVTIFIITTAGIVRILTFTAMSVDRFVAVAYPYYYSNRCSRGKVLILAGIIFIHAALSTLPTVVIDGWLIYNARNEAICRFTSPKNSLAYTAPMVIVNFAIPTITVLIMNCKVFIIARKQLKRVANEDGRYCHLCINQENSTAAKVNDEDKNQAKIEVKSERMILHAAADKQVKLPMIRIDEADSIPSKDKKESKFILSKSNDSKISDVTVKGIDKHRDSTAMFKQSVALNVNSKDFDKECSSIQSDTSQMSNYTARPSKLKRQNSIFKVSTQNTRCKHSNARKNSKEIVIALSTIVLAFAFIITWAPFVVTRLIITIWKDSNSPRLQTYTSASTVINSGLNPILILLTRKEVRQILSTKLLKRRTVLE